MSDGISEARIGTYFLDRSGKYDEEKAIKERISYINTIISDYKSEISELRDRLKQLEVKKK